MLRIRQATPQVIALSRASRQVAEGFGDGAIMHDSNGGENLPVPLPGRSAGNKLVRMSKPESSVWLRGVVVPHSARLSLHLLESGTCLSGRRLLRRDCRIMGRLQEEDVR